LPSQCFEGEQGQLHDVLACRMRGLLGDAAPHGVACWNDTRRTVDEVIALLERVAAGEGAS
jgi:hypothetical protein